MIWCVFSSLDTSRIKFVFIYVYLFVVLSPLLTHLHLACTNIVGMTEFVSFTKEISNQLNSVNEFECLLNINRINTNIYIFKKVTKVDDVYSKRTLVADANFCPDSKPNGHTQGMGTVLLLVYNTVVWKSRNVPVLADGKASSQCPDYFMPGRVRGLRCLIVDFPKYVCMT